VTGVSGVAPTEQKEEGSVGQSYMGPTPNTPLTPSGSDDETITKDLILWKDCETDTAHLVSDAAEKNKHGAVTAVNRFWLPKEKIVSLTRTAETSRVWTVTFPKRMWDLRPQNDPLG
jgi:hypothetical protein